MTSNTPSPSFDVVVIGASQAGLAIGHHLARRGVRFVIVDAAADIGQAWGSRWDSLKLFTPAQYSGLPGLAFPAPKDTYPTKDEVVAYLRSYASDLPVMLNADVRSLRRSEGEYVVATADQVFRADQVVVATGPFQVPFVPAFAEGLDDTVFQIHSAGYRNPAQLPDGDVLVVGGGNSGFQIAEELAATRKVGLAVGQRVPSLPQRFLGKDLFWWLSGVGFMKVSTDSRLGRKLSQRDVLIGSSARRLRRSGVTLRKRLTHAVGRRVGFEDGSEQGTSISSSGRPAIEPTTPGSRSRQPRQPTAPSFTVAASPRLRASSSSGCHGSTPGGLRSSASSMTTRPSSPAA